MGTQPHPSAYDHDLYARLQVHPKAQPEVIDAAHRALLKLYGARRENDDEKKARELGEAHIVLSTERRKYDEYRRSLKDQKTLGPYRIVNKIAEGGFGTTYKAEHLTLNEYSCIKDCSEISAHASNILRQETKAIWNLSHPGLPGMRDWLTLDDGSHALVSSWIEGPTLQQFVEKHGKFDPEHVAWITDRLLNTLWYLHDHGVMHGDIKPQNIIIRAKDHEVVLVDFGLSVVNPTATSTSKGYTELFSPPEQIAGRVPVPASDFYSLGMTMIYVLCGGSLDAFTRKMVPVSVPEPMSDFIKKLTARNVLERPRLARALCSEFRDEVRVKCFGRSHSNMKPLTY